jgi:N-methylhydantoinase A
VLLAAFEDEHERLYGVRGEPGSPIEIRALRLSARGPSSAIDRLSLVEQPPDRPGTRTVSFGGEPLDVEVRTRASIGAEPEPGPLLVDEYDTTVVVRLGWTVRRDLATETLILEQP